MFYGFSIGFDLLAYYCRVVQYIISSGNDLVPNQMSVAMWHHLATMS